MRLIDADALLKKFTKATVPYLRGIMEIPVVRLETINNAPTVDAVPVVRCKDCKHKPRGTGANHDVEFPDEVCPCQCEDYWYSWMPQDNFFCAWGERKEDE